MLVLTMEGQVVSASSENASLLPQLPTETLLLQLNDQRSFIGLEPGNSGQLSVRVALNIYLDQKRHILQAIYPFSPRIDNLADNVESGFAKYNELRIFERQTKDKFHHHTYTCFTFQCRCFYLGSILLRPIFDTPNFRAISCHLCYCRWQLRYFCNCQG